jgi:hypothetical protein
VTTTHVILLRATPTNFVGEGWLQMLPFRETPSSLAAIIVFRIVEDGELSFRNKLCREKPMKRSAGGTEEGYCTGTQDLFLRRIYVDSVRQS